MKTRCFLSLPLLCALAACSPKLPTPGPPPILQSAASDPAPSHAQDQAVIASRRALITSMDRLADSP